MRGLVLARAVGSPSPTVAGCLRRACLIAVFTTDQSVSLQGGFVSRPLKGTLSRATFRPAVKTAGYSHTSADAGLGSSVLLVCVAAYGAPLFSIVTQGLRHWARLFLPSG
jgi:hypothetical protein